MDRYHFVKEPLDNHMTAWLVGGLSQLPRCSQFLPRFILIRLLSVSVEYHMYFVIDWWYLFEFLVNILVGSILSRGRYFGAVRPNLWYKGRLPGQNLVRVRYYWSHLLLLVHYGYVRWSSAQACTVFRHWRPIVPRYGNAIACSKLSTCLLSSMSAVTVDILLWLVEFNRTLALKIA